MADSASCMSFEHMHQLTHHNCPLCTFEAMHAKASCLLDMHMCLQCRC